MATPTAPSFLRLMVKAGLQSGTVMMMGDAVAQTFMGNEAYSTSRSARFALVGCTLHGPYFFVCFRHLDKIFGPAVNLRTVLMKTAVAQVVVFPAYVVALFAYLGFLDGAPSITDNVTHKAPQAFVAGCGFWPVANMFGFKFIPSTARVPYLAACGVFWNTYISWMDARNDARKQRSTEQQE